MRGNRGTSSSHALHHGFGSGKRSPFYSSHPCSSTYQRCLLRASVLEVFHFTTFNIFTRTCLTAPSPPADPPSPISSLPTTTSGMLPGFISGFYSYDECHIDLCRLASFAKARLIHAEASGIDVKVRALSAWGNEGGSEGRGPVQWPQASTPSWVYGGVGGRRVGAKPEG